MATAGLRSLGGVAQARPRSIPHFGGRQTGLEQAVPESRLPSVLQGFPVAPLRLVLARQA
ncbi:MAG: hypothetical protein WA254_18690 [Candidatus Sulfotelmatobacter sp.]